MYTLRDTTVGDILIPKLINKTKVNQLSPINLNPGTGPNDVVSFRTNPSITRKKIPDL